MVGHNPLVLEQTIAASEPSKGNRSQVCSLIPKDLFNWKTSAGLVLTGGTAPAIAALTTQVNNYGLKWVFNSAAVITCRFEVPDEWADSEQDLILFAKARKIDAAADENATLALQVVCRWIKPDGITVDSVTATSAVLAASSAGAGALAPYTLDIGKALATAGKKIPRGATVQLEFSPTANVGTADMILEVSGIQDQTRFHAALKTKANRKAK